MGCVLDSRPSLRVARTGMMRTFPTLTFSHVAEAAFVCSCGETLLAAQRISPNQPFRSSKLENSKLPFRCTRVQQSGRGRSRPSCSLVECPLSRLGAISAGQRTIWVQDQINISVVAGVICQSCPSNKKSGRSR